MIWPLPRPEEQAAEADPLRRVHALTRDVLAQLQSWLARPDTANTQPADRHPSRGQRQRL